MSDRAGNHPDNRKKRIVLDADSFEVLVNGGMVMKDGVELILQDIGFKVMNKVLVDAMGDNDEQSE